VFLPGMPEGAPPTGVTALFSEVRLAEPAAPTGVLWEGEPRDCKLDEAKEALPTGSAAGLVSRERLLLLVAPTVSC